MIASRPDRHGRIGARVRRQTLLWAAIALAVAACGSTPVPTPGMVSQAPSSPVVTPAPTTSVAPTASPSPSASAITSLRLTSKFRGQCRAIGGCAAYVALIPVGGTSLVEIKLAAQGGAQHVLPALIGPGSYTVRFRLAAVTDPRAVGAPPVETTIATCETPIKVFNQAAVNISVTFERDSCEAAGTYTVAIIN